MSNSCCNRISSQLKNLGLKEGGSVLVHSSLKSLGHVPGGVGTVIDGILSALGDEGALLMPALSYEYVTEDRPIFDCAHTPSNIGAIPEFFRQKSEVMRSVHPTHSVCGIGRNVEALLGYHDLDDSPCGPNSPYRRLYEAGGQILLIGCGLKPNTSMHGVEEAAQSPYVFGNYIEHEIIYPDGSVRKMNSWRHGFTSRGLIQRYDRVADILGEDEIRSGKLLDATVYILEAKPLWEKSLEIMEEDPYYFVDRS